MECLLLRPQSIPKLHFPNILFMNRSKDYRDSEHRWLELCVNKKSELKVYEGGDYFLAMIQGSWRICFESIRL